MKRLSWVIIYIIFALSVVACKSNSNGMSNGNWFATAPCNTSTRIRGVEYIFFRGIRYDIIEVDGKEYLSGSQGGFIELKK